MPTSLPAKLLGAWVLFFVFLLSQMHYEHAAKSDPFGTYRLRRVISASTALGMLSGLGVLAYYFMHAAWYWPPILALGGSMAGAFVMGVLLNYLSGATISALGLVGWPAAVWWAISTIQQLR